ncbi:rhodanese-like domain-containing protein [Streptomyces sp. NBC_01795]|uniref:rhodanese-like domain-containing protein n=1 Tax=unclassified Streptomyces TaxID=2593676 RepID=UPI002DDBB87C|nr:MULTISPECIES: rhodanese-like domain-containing protein [unclassified Streptomyces]WSA91913.1 rhodanese-like domain-containing protein [Streptomyces sp. NBC_01795]WSB76281.1 rhodanese-like domain-containing protein [Streptomyces sp. NBC_01775]WSB82036.1 rhodanese-like domain-containing protein [Streptomyces sp. NBC_01775]
MPATASAAITSAVLSVPAAAPAEAAAHYAARLAFEADVSDVHADLASGSPGVVVVDTRSNAAWDQGHIPGALHIPTAQIADLAPQLIDPAQTVVTYCWGPGCNGATRAALAFARLGYQVKEMLGGFEYWAREGFAYDSATGAEQRPVDDLAAPRSGISCAC